MAKKNFYIGKEIELKEGQVVEVGDFTIPSDILQTHALIIGATGSGKTVVCKTIIEEALLSDIPIIAIDPKGDISATGIVFDQLTPEVVLPLVRYEAQDMGIDPHDLAQETIDLYQKNLSRSYGEVRIFEEKLQEFAAKVRVMVIAPHQDAGVELSTLPEFEIIDKENPEIVDLKVQILLEQAGYENVKATDNKAMYLVHLLDHYWEVDGYKTVTLQSLIRGVMDPPIEKVGMIPVDKFISKKIREDVARNLNSLMLKAKPGAPLNIAKLFNLAKTSLKESENPDNPPDLSKVVPLLVFDLRGISNEKDKQSFVAQVLGAVHRWIWEKGGTSRLRALLYFDELFGFMPPVRKTPSKQILLLLLKQARSFGLGLVLATQNPGDLDYRGLGNIGTWFVGRLAAKTDIQKVSRGLRAVLEAQGKVEDEIRDILNKIQGLKPGQFLFQNARLGVKRLKSRWLLSYHKGPLVPEEIQIVSVIPPISDEALEGEEGESAGESGIAQEEQETPVENELEKYAKYFVELGEIRPEFEDFAEKYIPVKVKPDPARLTKVLAHRLGFPKNVERKGFAMDFHRIVPYYAPMLVFPVEVLIEDDVEYKDVLVSISLAYEYTRAVDLRYDLDWEAEVSEDIHPASFPTKQLKIVPEPSIKNYLTLKGVEADKLEDNLRWYITKNSYEGTDELLRKAIFDAKETGIKAKQRSAKYEKQKLDKQLDKISADRSIAEVQLQELRERVDALQKELTLIEQEGKSTMQAKKSISAAERRQNSLEAKISTLDIKYAEADKNLQELQREVDNLAEIYNELAGMVGKSSLFEKFYLPEKGHIKIPDKQAFFIPRVRVLVQFTRDGHQQNHIFDLNLYNANGHIACSICKDDHEDILREPLGITPPRVLCPNCLDVFCLNHMVECHSCGSENMTCQNCAGEFKCAVCGQTFCHNHVFKCASCGKIVCEEHLYECHGCGNFVCMDCVKSRVVLKSEPEVRVCKLCPPK